MMDNRWLTELNSSIEAHASLYSQWNKFIELLEIKKEDQPYAHKLLIEKIRVEGDLCWDWSFSKGLNLMEPRDTAGLELFYLIKLCLTGKNNLSHDLKAWIERIYLQFNLDQQVYTAHVTLTGKMNGSIYSCNIDETLSHKPEEHQIVVECKNHKEIQLHFKSFFSQKLCLPYLKNVNHQDGRLSAHPITFATYFSLFSLDSKRPFKIFSEAQSGFWRKRVLQVLVGLQGIPFLSFFQTAHSENLSLEPQVSKWKDELLLKLSQSKYEDLSVWEQRLLQLTKRKEKLNDLKHSFSESYDEQFNLNIKLMIDQDIKEAQSSLQHYYTKEILILQEIQHLGGDFQAKKSHKRHLKASEQQFPLFKPRQDKTLDHKTAITELIGDYYLNLSQIEVLQSDIEDLVSKEKIAFNKNRTLDEKRSEEIQEDINRLDKEINDLLKDNISHTDTAGFEGLDMNSLLERDLTNENETILQCIDLLKRQFREIHVEKLNRFLLRLKDNLNLITSWKVHSVHINKHYMPTIIYEDYGDFMFSSLPEEQKWLFTLALFATLLHSSLSEGGLSPSLLILDLPDEQKELRESISRIVNSWSDLGDKDYQIIIM